MEACDVEACYVEACDVEACDVEACDVEACDVEACDVEVCGAGGGTHLEGLGHEAGELRVVDADEAVRRARRVEHRAEDVEGRAHLERTAHRHDGAHRRMEPRRKHKRDPRLL